jgi:hypothetical protein
VKSSKLYFAKNVPIIKISKPNETIFKNKSKIYIQFYLSGIFGKIKIQGAIKIVDKLPKMFETMTSRFRHADNNVVVL